MIIKWGDVSVDYRMTASRNVILTSVLDWGMYTKTVLLLFSAIKKKSHYRRVFLAPETLGTSLTYHKKYLFSKRISALHFIVSIVNRPFYSFRWERSLSWLCLDTTLPAAKFAYKLEHRETLFIIIVRRLSSKFSVNCALLDTSMKFGTLIVVTNTSRIFRYSVSQIYVGFHRNHN